MNPDRGAKTEVLWERPAGNDLVPKPWYAGNDLLGTTCGVYVCHFAYD